jgi:hypothetical protein
LLPYIVITPAHNEERFIEKTIESMIHQTVLPLKWLIVNDGSTDRTAQIVSRYVAEHPWICMVQMPHQRDRSFAAKVQAFNAGREKARGLEYEIIGNVDADVSFERDHFEFLVRKLSDDVNLGVAGSVYIEEGYSSERDSFGGHKYVSGLCQLFRRQCWEEIGGYVPLPAGGEDWMAVTTARMMGWKTKSFREKCFIHHRPRGSAAHGILASSFSYGQQDYYLGGHPLWQLFRTAYQATRRPYIIKGLALGLGYCWAFVCRMPRAATPELMAFHRKEQMVKLKIILKSMLRFKTVDNFNVLPD